ncbi:unnamed protein product [Rhizophagus irregularis]|nr:unnamed protein product [Rhizophagus irregularis]
MSQDLNSVTQPCNSTSLEEKICSELDSKCKKGKSVDKLKQELFASELSSQEPSIEQNHVTKISETLCPRKVISDKSSIDEASQHLAQLCDKAFDAEDKANRANQEEILCWYLYAKDFIIQLNGIIESSGGKFGEKKARGLLATSISELTNEQIQDVIDYGISSEKLPLNNVLEVLFPKESTAPIPLAHDSVPKGPSNSSDNSKEEAWFDEDMFFNEANSTKVNTVTSDDDVYFSEANEVNKHDGDPNSINDDSDSDSNSEDEIPDDSDDDGYNRYGGYGGYNEYGERDSGYYYRDGRYERKSSPMMSPIISPVTA